MSKNNHLEAVKSFIILLLTACLVFLVWRSDVFGRNRVNRTADVLNSSLIDDSSGGTYTGVSSEAARPLAIVITAEAGIHSAAKYDMAARDALYERTVNLFTESLASAGEPKVIGETMWKEALSAPGISYIYSEPIQLSIIDSWFGAEILGLWKEMTTCQISLFISGNTVHFAFQDELTRLYYSVDTNISCDSITSAVSEKGYDRAYYLFESDKLDNIKRPYTLIFPDITAHAVIFGENPIDSDEVLSQILRQLGINMELSSSFRESDGTLVFIDDDFTVRVTPAGELSMHFSGATLGESAGAENAVETVQRIVHSTCGKYCGDAEVQFVSLCPETDGSYRTEFAYMYCGGRIFTGKDGFAVSAVIRGGMPTDLHMYFRTYNTTGEVMTVIPELQAAAASDGSFMLGYSDSESSTLVPEWFFR